jgi:hypothetical protein
MGIYANDPQPMVLTARYLPHNGASSAPEYAPGSRVCSPATRMYSKVEYSDPNYRQNLRVSPAGYPRGYIGATTGATTDCTGRVGHHLKRGKHMLSRCRYLLDQSSVLLGQRCHSAHILLNLAGICQHAGELRIRLPEFLRAARIVRLQQHRLHGIRHRKIDELYLLRQLQAVIRTRREPRGGLAEIDISR